MTRESTWSYLRGSENPNQIDTRMDLALAAKPLYHTKTGAAQASHLVFRYSILDILADSLGAQPHVSLATISRIPPPETAPNKLKQVCNPS
jgi:hypothetical protein